MSQKKRHWDIFLSVPLNLNSSCVEFRFPYFHVNFEAFAWQEPCTVESLMAPRLPTRQHKLVHIDHKKYRSMQIAIMTTRPSVRKGKKLNVWLESRMKSAIEEFHKGEHGLRHIARGWDVPKSMLARSITGYKHPFGHKPILPPSADNDLSELITTLSAGSFPKCAGQYSKQ